MRRNMGLLSAYQEIQDRDGQTLVYGAGDNAKLTNPINGRVFSWQLESSTDVNNNQITYTYDLAASANVAYLQRIAWGVSGSLNRSVDFVLNNPSSAPRADRPVTARSGMRQQFDRRVVQLDVKAASGALVTRYVLTYGFDADSLRSRLAVVQRVGSSGSASLPAYTFFYSERAVGDGFKQTNEPGFWSTATTCAPGGGFWTNSIGQNYLNIADMNRDGLADLYYVHDLAYSTGRAEVALGTGTIFRPGAGSSCSGATPRGTPWSSDRLLFSSVAPSATYQDSSSATIDLDGDGFPDHFDLGGSPAPAGGSSTVLMGFRLGSATGFSAATYSTSFDLAHSWAFTFGADANLSESWIRLAAAPSGSTLQTYGLLADVTGDGRPDFLAARDDVPFYFSGNSTWANWNGFALFVNRGLKPAAGGGWYLDFGTTPAKLPAPLLWGGTGAPTIEQMSNGITTIAFVDQNGDGLPDRVSSTGVSYGYGAGFTANETLFNNLYYDLVVSPQYTQVGLYDLNGDGFLDQVAKPNSLADAYWHVHFGTGHGFNPNEAIFRRVIDIIDQPAIEADGQNITSRSIRDVNGDGRLDYVASGAGSVFLQERLLNHTGAKSEPLAGLLTRAIDPLGGTTEFFYKSALEFQDSTGLPANPGMSMPKPVVAELAYSDGRAGTAKIENLYSYSGGVFDYAEKEFRGFASVTVTLIEGATTPTITTSSYLTDRSCAGALSSRQVQRGTAVFGRESTAFVTVSGGAAIPNEWTQCLPSAAIVESVEGSEATKKVQRTSWDYGNPINADYNPVSITEWGEWNPATNQNVAGDERVTSFTYAAAPSAYPKMVSRVKTETVTDLPGNVYAKRTTCYELPACSGAGNGRVLEIRDLLTDVTLNPPVVNQERVVAKLGYDAYGNVTSSTGASTVDDPDGQNTFVTYDADYRTFPVLVKVSSDATGSPAISLNTVVDYTGCGSGYAPPPALGLPCSISPPDQKLTLTGYDTFGRVTRIERPSSGYLETRVYNLATAGQAIFETRLTVGSEIHLYKRFVDGLARVYREESPGTATETVSITRSFDSRGRLATESLPFTGTSAPVRSFTYDAVGRSSATVDFDGSTQRVVSYGPWLVVDEAYFGPATAGNRKERTERSLDGLGRLARVAQFEDAVAAATPYVVTAKYDPLDQLYELRDPIANDPSLCSTLNMGPQCATQDHVTEVVWDTFGRRVKIDDPDSGIWLYRYDDAGLVKERTQNSGTSASRSQLYTYDRVQRLVQKSFTPAGNGSANATFVYGNSSSPTTIDDYGKLIQVTSTTTEYLFGHDAAGRLDAVIQKTAGKSFGSVGLRVRRPRPRHPEALSRQRDVQLRVRWNAAEDDHRIVSERRLHGDGAEARSIRRPRPAQARRDRARGERIAGCHCRLHLRLVDGPPDTNRGYPRPASLRRRGRRPRRGRCRQVRERLRPDERRRRRDRGHQQSGRDRQRLPVRRRERERSRHERRRQRDPELWLQRYAALEAGAMRRDRGRAVQPERLQRRVGGGVERIGEPAAVPGEPGRVRSVERAGHPERHLRRPGPAHLTDRESGQRAAEPQLHVRRALPSQHRERPLGEARRRTRARSRGPTATMRSATCASRRARTGATSPTRAPGPTTTPPSPASCRSSPSRTARPRRSARRRAAKPR